jgi:shikimate 5-dehydrogenase
LGIPASDGGEMLVLQGAASFRLWWGIEPSLSSMRGALEAARRREVR